MRRRIEIDTGLDETYYSLVKTINISRLKAHISQELLSVRRGERIVILDRDIPIAQLIPYEESTAPLVPQAPTRALELRKVGISVEVDPLAVLMAERRER